MVDCAVLAGETIMSSATTALNPFHRDSLTTGLSFCIQQPHSFHSFALASHRFGGDDKQFGICIAMCHDRPRFGALRAIANACIYSARDALLCIGIGVGVEVCVSSIILFPFTLRAIV